jgi:hypothetical protein
MCAFIRSVIGILDIFRIESYGKSVWIEACPDLETAKARIKMLMVSKPGEYFIFSTKTGHKQFFKPGADGTA